MRQDLKVHVFKPAFTREVSHEVTIDAFAGRVLQKMYGRLFVALAFAFLRLGAIHAHVIGPVVWDKVVQILPVGGPSRL